MIAVKKIAVIRSYERSITMKPNFSLFDLPENGLGVLFFHNQLVMKKKKKNDDKKIPRIQKFSRIQQS